MNISPTEIIVILVVALLVFGPQRLPELGRQVGGVLRELRRMQDTVRAEINEALQEPPAHASAVPAATPPSVEEPDHTDLPSPWGAGGGAPPPPPGAPPPPGVGFEGPPRPPP
ncbi:MAG: Sec-independent protein translocase subunit TatA/TatB, partial [Actinomycetota bacterium]